jgi:hypothetical protein
VSRLGNVGTAAPALGAPRCVLFCALAALLVALPLSGCIFSPREPDGPPGEGTVIPWEPPTDTDTVLANLAAALAGEGTSNYLGCFSSDYRFFVDPQDSLDAGQEADERYANWTKSDEEQAINAIFLDSATGIDVTFTNVTPPDEEAPITYRLDNYELTIIWQHGAHEPGESVTYRGRATIWLRKDETELWSIFRWVDRRLANQGNSSTWGVLRGDYR